MPFMGEKLANLMKSECVLLLMHVQGRVVPLPPQQLPLPLQDRRPQQPREVPPD